MLDSAVGIKKTSAAQGKMPFLPNLPGQDTPAFVSPWGRISENGLYIYYHHCTPAGLRGTTATQPDRWETTSEPLAGDSVVNGKNLLCSKFAVEKDQGQHAKSKHSKPLLLPVLSMGIFKDLAVVRFFFSISGLDLPLKFHFHTPCADLYSET